MSEIARFPLLHSVLLVKKQQTFLPVTMFHGEKPSFLKITGFIVFVFILLSDLCT